MTIGVCTYSSPVGDLLLASKGEQLVSLDYAGYEERFERLLRRRFPNHQRIERRAPAIGVLDRFFEGQLDAFKDTAIDCSGTDFETRVWSALREIAPGTTQTYGQVAARLGMPKSARAIGRANSMNPIAIIVPCHRVIGANESLTGYAGGLWRKQWLLEHERKHANHPARPRDQSVRGAVLIQGENAAKNSLPLPTS